MPESTSELSLQNSRNAHLSWAKTEDRTARTAPARNGLEQKFLDQAGGDPKRAESYRKAFYADLALKSARARARRRVESKPTDYITPEHLDEISRELDTVAEILRAGSRDGGAA